MILSLQALAPAALLLVGGLWLLVRPGPNVFVLVQVLALGTLVRLALLVSAAITVPVYNPLPDVPLVMRLDETSVFFAITAVAAALVVSLPWVNDRGRALPYGWMALAEFGAVGAILAGDLPGMAVGWGVAVAALLLLVLVPNPGTRELRRPSAAVTRTLVLHLGAAAVLLAGAVGVEALAGTTAFDAIPVGALDTRTGLLLAASSVLVLGTLAGLIRACRQPATAAVMVCAVLLPLAVYVLTRTFDLAEGRPLPGPVNSALVLGGGVGAILFALYALWAADLGSTVARLLNALGLLLVAAFGIGGSGGLVALLLGFLSLEVVAGAALVLLDAGGGRLPGRGPLPSWAMGIAALLPLAALAGTGLAMGLDARLLVARRLFELGILGLLLVVPVLLAMLLVAAGAVAAGRFGGGRVEGVRRVAQLLTAAVALVGMQLASPWLLDRAVALAAEAGHVPVADVRSTASASLPGALVAGAIVVLVLALVAMAALFPRVYSPKDGLRRAPDLLPPRLAVAPEIAARRLLIVAVQRAKKVAGGLREHARWVVVGSWVVALAAVALVSR